MGLFDFIFSSQSTQKSSKTYIDSNGYRRFRDTNTYVHRWVASKKLGRKLKSEERVHHINRNKLDNSPENLHVFANQEEHDAQHEMDARNHGWHYSLTGRRKKYTLYYIIFGCWQ